MTRAVSELACTLTFLKTTVPFEEGSRSGWFHANNTHDGLKNFGEYLQSTSSNEMRICQTKREQVICHELFARGSDESDNPSRDRVKGGAVGAADRSTRTVMHVMCHVPPSQRFAAISALSLPVLMQLARKGGAKQSAMPSPVFV